jgi:hypothetical protein
VDDALRIAFESGLRYSGLRGFSVDERLWHYLPPGVALRERVVPVILAGDVLTVAASRPDPDLSALQRSLPNLRLDVVIAPADEIERALAHSHPTAA